MKGAIRMRNNWSNLSRLAAWWMMMAVVMMLLSLAGFAPVTPVAASTSGPIGMVAGNTTVTGVHIFDAGSNTVLGTVHIPVPADGAIGDCSISRDGTLGFVTNFNFELYVIDLTQSPPVLAAGTNPIPISNPGEDTSTTPDGKYVVVVDGSGGSSVPISVVSIASRAEVSTFSVAANHNSVDVLSDGSVLVTSDDSSKFYRLRINSAGQLTNTGDVRSVSSPNNIYGAPNAVAGFVVTYDPPTVRSFLINGLMQVDNRTIPGSGICGVVNPAGNTVYVRTCDFHGTNSFVIAYRFNSATGALGAAPLFSIPVAACTGFYGIDQMAITPDGNRLYVPEGNVLKVYSADSGAPLGTISDSHFGELTGICFSPKIAIQTAVGGEIKGVDKFNLVIPWLAMALVPSVGVAFFVFSRRKESKTRPVK